MPLECFATKKDRFTQAQIVDPSGVRAAQGPVEIGGVAARHDVDAEPERRFDRVRERGELGHVPGLG